MPTEPWLNGTVEGIPALLMPVAHALMQAQQDIENFVGKLSPEQIWCEPNGAASIGFHLRHINGSCDRLWSYAKNESLTDEQFTFLAQEKNLATKETAAALIAGANHKIQAIIDYLRTVSEAELLAARFVGRARLTTNVIGLLFHIAEHTQRHVGSVIALSRVVA